MKKIKDRETDRLIFIDVEKLADMFLCGQATAKKIGEEAGARIVIGKRDSVYHENVTAMFITCIFQCW